MCSRKFAQIEFWDIEENEEYEKLINQIVETCFFKAFLSVFTNLY